MKALGASKLNLVTWLLKQLDSEHIFVLDPLPLSQTVLICLLQQLGSQLHNDTDLKLQWLKQIALALDRDDPNIAAFAPNMLSQLQASMREFQNTADGRNHSTELRLLMRVL